VPILVIDGSFGERDEILLRVLSLQRTVDEHERIRDAPFHRCACEPHARDVLALAWGERFDPGIIGQRSLRESTSPASALRVLDHRITGTRRLVGNPNICNLPSATRPSRTSNRRRRNRFPSGSSSTAKVPLVSSTSAELQLPHTPP